MSTTQSASDPHLFLEGEAGECLVCSLPEANRIHNARPVRINPRTKRQEYVK